MGHSGRMRSPSAVTSGRGRTRSATLRTALMMRSSCKASPGVALHREETVRCRQVMPQAGSALGHGPLAALGGRSPGRWRAPQRYTIRLREPLRAQDLEGEHRGGLHDGAMCEETKVADRTRQPDPRYAPRSGTPELGHGLELSGAFPGRHLCHVPLGSTVSSNTLTCARSRAWHPGCRAPRRHDRQGHAAPAWSSMTTAQLSSSVSAVATAAGPPAWSATLVSRWWIDSP